MSVPKLSLKTPQLKSTPLERALKSENLKLQNKIGRLEAQIITLKNSVSVLKKGGTKMPDPVASMSQEEIEDSIKATLRKFPRLAKIIGVSHG